MPLLIWPREYAKSTPGIGETEVWLRVTHLLLTHYPGGFEFFAALFGIATTLTVFVAALIVLYRHRPWFTVLYTAGLLWILSY